MLVFLRKLQKEVIVTETLKMLKTSILIFLVLVEKNTAEKFFFAKEKINLSHKPLNIPFKINFGEKMELLSSYSNLLNKIPHTSGMKRVFIMELQHKLEVTKKSFRDFLRHFSERSEENRKKRNIVDIIDTSLKIFEKILGGKTIFHHKDQEFLSNIKFKTKLERYMNTTNRHFKILENHLKNDSKSLKMSILNTKLQKFGFEIKNIILESNIF